MNTVAKALSRDEHSRKGVVKRVEAARLANPVSPRLYHVMRWLCPHLSMPIVWLKISGVEVVWVYRSPIDKWTTPPSPGTFGLVLLRIIVHAFHRLSLHVVILSRFLQSVSSAHRGRG